MLDPKEWEIVEQALLDSMQSKMRVSTLLKTHDIKKSSDFIDEVHELRGVFTKVQEGHLGAGTLHRGDSFNGINLTVEPGVSVMINWKGRDGSTFTQTLTREGVLHDLLPVPQPSNGMQLIAAERGRQMMVKGYGSEHDDLHRNHELVDAAKYHLELIKGPRTTSWPFTDGYPLVSSPVSSLFKAGALIVAELDRILRLRRDGK